MHVSVILEGVDNGIQKALQIRSLIGHDIRGIAVIESGTEDIDNHLFAVQVNRCRSPVNPDSLPGLKPQRNESLRFLTNRTHIVDQVPIRGFAADITFLIYQTYIDSTYRMPLFLDPFPVVI